MHGAPGNTSRKSFMQQDEKKGFTIIQLAIIRAALQARERLGDLSPNPERLRRDLHLLHIGQDLLRRLQAAGVKLPEINLTDPPPAAAAAPHVDGRQLAAGNHP